MTLPASGSLSMSQVAVELGLPATTTLGMNDSRVRDLAGGIAAGAQYSMSALYGKTAVTPTNPLSGSGGTYIDNDPTGGGQNTVTLWVKSDGTTQIVGSYGGVLYNGTWATPVGAGIGSPFYARFTLQSSNNSGPAGSHSASTGWMNLASNQSVSSIANSSLSAAGMHSATYVVDISKDGTNILASGTFTLKAQAAKMV